MRRRVPILAEPCFAINQVQNKFELGKRVATRTVHHDLVNVVQASSFKINAMMRNGGAQVEESVLSNATGYGR